MDYIYFSTGLLLVGAGFIYFTNKRAYEKGIIDAIQLHRTGRLEYHEYYDERGEKMLDIEIAPKEDEE